MTNKNVLVLIRSVKLDTKILNMLFSIIFISTFEYRKEFNFLNTTPSEAK